MVFKNQPWFILVCVSLLLQSHFGSAISVQGGYWYPDSGILASDIDSTLFTHLFCAYADLDRATYQVVIPSSKATYFSSFTQTVQRKNPSVKTLLSIGGYASNSDDFATMASQASTRKTFIDSSIRLAQSNKFHGLELAWLYPNTTEKMTNLGLLLKEWRAAVAAQATGPGSTTLFLSAQVYYSSDYYSPDNLSNPIGYNISDIASSLDWINLIAYYFYAPAWSNTTGPPAALYNPGNRGSGDYGVTKWIQSGMPPKKLVLTFPFYGYAWQLINADNNGLFAPTSGAANATTNISREGLMQYNKIKEFISDNGATPVYNSTVVLDYCYSGTTWIGYDDIQSISTKVSYVKEKGLLGYSAWHVGADANWVLSQQAQKTSEDPKSNSTTPKASEDPKSKPRILVMILVSTSVVILLSCSTICYICRKSLGLEDGIGSAKRSLKRLKCMKWHSETSETLDSNSNLRAFSYASLKAATNNFSSQNKLGEGGFGPVYKGKLLNEQLIAVKRLSKASSQGHKEFKNEVMLTARLQHVNLTRLLGFCTDKEEKMLIYEYMPGQSLHYHLFDPTRKHLLNWEKRIHIIQGVTQGLLYLQEYSNFTIIHRDLKASNILLDSEFNAKISDFGMARLFSKNEVQANASRVVGTYGFVPPEYVREGILSMKSDVYSFGVLLLQIVGGKRTNCFYGPDENLNLLDFAYELWKNDRGKEFIDPALENSSSLCEVMKCLHIALLCVQEDRMERPTMLEISSMLRNEAAPTITPKKPAYSIKKGGDDEKKEQDYSINDAQITDLAPR